MKNRSIVPTRVRFILTGTCLALFAGCVTTTSPTGQKESEAAKALRQARSTHESEEERAGYYLRAAALTAPLLGTGAQATPERAIYNSAAAELTTLLRSDEQGRLWNHPVTVAADGATYRLRFQPGRKNENWAPDYFMAFKPASQVPEKIITQPDRQDGVGGALVGIRKKDPRENFAPLVGITAPVTATLDFQGKDVTLALRDPRTQTKTRVAGAERPLAGDFSAPLAYYPAPNETIMGLMGALHVANYMDQTGLYTLQPYDPDRIPVLLVHGLISTARMWRNVVNELEKDPMIRKRYQFWVFNYPTGNPVVYSSLRCREELAKVEKTYGLPHGFVLVGHSMGGIVARMQAATLDQAAWDRGLGKNIDHAFSEMPKDSIVYRCVIFHANPKIRRVVFICTPHRGATMATGTIGQIAMRLIALPANLVSVARSAAGNVMLKAIGRKTLPNSINSLSPENPTLKVVASVPIQAPYHTIFGDRGIHDEPNSTDGVVPYWSSHVDKPLSELSVPGPHGSCELPQTIDELKRILHLQLKTAGN